MIFKNFKDWEFLIVEPVKFTMKRDANRPLLYNYTIQFRVLGHYTVKKLEPNFLDKIDNGLNVAKTALDGARGVFLKFQEVIRSTAGAIDDTVDNLRRLTLAIKAARGVAITMQDVSRKTYSNFFSSADALFTMAKLSRIPREISALPAAAEAAGIDISTLPDEPEEFSASLTEQSRPGTQNATAKLLKAVDELSAALDSVTIEDFPAAAINSILAEQEEAAGISRSQVQSIRDQLASLRNRFADSAGLNDETYDSLFGLISSGDVAPDFDNTDIEFEILYGFYLGIQAIDSLLSSDEMFDINAAIFARDESASSPDTVGAGVFSTLNPNNGTKEGIVPVGASLEDIALAELGDSARWTELAELNSLKYPYIDNSNVDVKRINYTVKSTVYSNPVDIRGLKIGSYYLIPQLPIPVGAFENKAGKLAQFTGGDQTLEQNWRFISAQVGTLIRVVDWAVYLELNENLAWEEVEYNENSLTEVLKPGDIIKIPLDRPSPVQDFTRGPRDNPVTSGLSRSEKALGVDLKISETSDLKIGPNGDLELSVGSDNAAQAIVLKLLYERGDLKKHPEIGTQLKVGGKMPNVGALRSQVASTLLQDERITDVRNINIRQVNSTLELSFDVFLVEVSEPVPVTIPI
jgi:nucleoid-associated protein YgaU